MYSFDAYFKVAAEILKHQNKNQTWKDIELSFAEGAEVFAKYTKTEDFSSRLVVEALTSEHEISSDSIILKILNLF